MTSEFPGVGHRYFVDFVAFQVELDFASETSLTYYNLDKNGNKVGSETVRLRDEMFNETLFRSLARARFMLEAWRADFNTSRPHSRLGWMTPNAYAEIRRSGALRSTDGSAPRIAAITAQQGIADRPIPIVMDKTWRQAALSTPAQPVPTQNCELSGKLADFLV